ncbi:hypothetical protein [Dysgonomonas sp.]
MKQFYVVLLAMCIILLSCKEQKQQSDFSFQIAELDLSITTSKRIGAEFYVMFSKDSTSLSDSIDYLKYETGDMSKINLIFNPLNKDSIYIEKSEYLKSVSSINYNLKILEKSEFYSLFFEPQPLVRSEPFMLKYPFIFVSIYTSTYGIYIKKNEVHFEWIKEGDILGGW